MKKNVFKSVLMAISLLTLCAFIYCSCTDPDSTDKDEINVGNNVTVNGNNSVYVYNLNGIAQYVYDSFGRVSEIITRDPITFNPYIVDSDSDTCKYVYNDDGILESLVYFGRTFYSSDKDENGRTVKAICGDKNGDIYVDISYNSNGVIVQETFYENGVQVLKNSFDADARPVTSKYTDFGTLTFDYYDKETYITVDSKDSDASSLAITLYLDDNYLPQYCMQSIDSAVMRTTWTVDEYGRCVDTLIESTSEGYSLTEKYEIYYTDNKMSNVKYYVPDNDGAPRISTDTEYTYSENGEFIAQTETKYDSAGELLQISVYDYSDDLVEKTTIEYYTEGVREKTEISSKAYDSNGHVTESSQYEILADGTYSVAKKTSLAYDDAGNLSSRTTYFYDTTNTLENYLTETYTYDGYGKVLKAEYIAYDSAETCIERELDEFVYDGNNVITTSVSMFDANNKLISKTVTEKKYDSEGKETSSVVTTYDSEGNVVQSK